MYSGRSRREFGGTGAPGHILCPTKVTQIDTDFDQTVVRNNQKGVPGEVTLAPPSLPWGWGAAGHYTLPHKGWGVQSARKL